MADHEVAQDQSQDPAFNKELQPIHNLFQEIESIWTKLKQDHVKGVVTRDVNAARRRARVLSVELSKKLKEYRELSKDYGKK